MNHPADAPMLVSAIVRDSLAATIEMSFATISPGQAYIPGWHIEAMAYQLERLERGEINRLIITLPPRNLKSIAASVAFAAWCLGRDPTRRIIGVSYGQELAGKHSRDCRAVMQSPWYRSAFPNTHIDPKKNTESEFATTRKGFRMATSIGGSLTGRGGDLIIIDDPHKPDEVLSDDQREKVHSWFGNTLLSRLDNKHEGAIVVIQQRVHEDDLAGRLIEKGGWVHLNLPAIAEEAETIAVGPGMTKRRRPGDVLHPERESLADLEALKRDMGSYTFAGQYQQNPVPAGGGLVQLKWLRTYEKLPPSKAGDLIIQSWDTALTAKETSDYSVCLTFLRQGKNHYLLDVFRDRLEFPSLEPKVIELAAKFAASYVIIEDAGSGTALIQCLRHVPDLRVGRMKPSTDKATRLMTQSPAIEQGYLHVPQDAPWLATFVREVTRFPKSRHDDQVDALSQYLEYGQKLGLNLYERGILF